MVGSGAYTTLNEPAHALAFNEVVVLLLGLFTFAWRQVSLSCPCLSPGRTSTKLAQTLIEL